MSYADQGLAALVGAHRVTHAPRPFVSVAPSLDPPCCSECEHTGGRCGDAAPMPVVGAVLPRVVWPSDVEKYKDRLDPAMVGTNDSVGACKGLGPEERSAWSLFYASWTKYRATPVGIWGSSNEWDATEVFERSLKAWQEQLSTKCALSTPTVKGPDDTVPDWSIIKWASVAVVAVAAVAGLAYVAPMVTPFIPSGPKKRV